MVIVMIPLIFIAAAIIIIMLVLKKPTLAPRYDERQKAVRALGYKSALWTLVGYIFISGYLLEDGILWASPICSAFIGIILALMVFVAICIFQDSYFAINENPKKFTFLFIFLICINVFIFYINLMEDPENIITQSGTITYKAMNLFTAMALLFVLICLWIKKYLDSRIDKIEDDDEGYDIK